MMRKSCSCKLEAGMGKTIETSPKISDKATVPIARAMKASAMPMME